MFTLNKFLAKESTIGNCTFAGFHYETEKPVFTVHLNYDSHNRIYDLCEQAGIDYRFDDEIICDEQGRAHESQPGFYGDVMTWTWFDECSIIARDEIDDSLDYWAEQLTDNPNKADKWNTDFSSLGFVRHDGKYESGFHPGQTDNPETIQAELLKTYDHVIWSIDSIGQFDCGFSAWVKNDD